MGTGTHINVGTAGEAVQVYALDMEQVRWWELRRTRSQPTMSA
jgi:hypothetical protein